MVNVKDDYFAVGGTSISAGQLAFKLRKAFGMKSMTGADIFELRTIEEIAKRIDAKKSGGNSKDGSAADDKSKKVPLGPVNWVEPHSSVQGAVDFANPVNSTVYYSSKFDFVSMDGIFNNLEHNLPRVSAEHALVAPHVTLDCDEYFL